MILQQCLDVSPNHGRPFWTICFVPLLDVTVVDDSL